MKNNAPVGLVILDGFGYSESYDGNAIAHAHMPCFSELLATYPTALLQASGKSVGLPDGYMGNSEVGHITLGCGTVIKQPFTIMQDAIDHKKLAHISVLVEALHALKNSGKTLHLMGIASNAGVHGSLEHLFAFLELAKNIGLSHVILHLFLDGRDCNPHEATHYLSLVEAKLSELKIGTIGTLQGRFYAMDRNKNWDQTRMSYQILTQEQTNHTIINHSNNPHARTTKNISWQTILQKSYQAGISDEFISPVQLCDNAYIKPGDGIIFYNCRPDRMRQLTACFLTNHLETGVIPIPTAFFITPFSLGDTYQTTTLFKRQHVPETLNSYLDAHNYTIFSIAETEKYAHITYFFNGGREEKLPNETRVLIPSITRKDYEKFPAMSALEITQAIDYSLQQTPCDFYAINYANADMVGHTGNFNATVKALEILDNQLTHLVQEFVTKRNGTLIITSDHGKAESMINKKTGEPITAHTSNPVYCIVISQKLAHSHYELPLHELKDVAPFIIQILQDTPKNTLL